MVIPTKRLRNGFEMPVFGIGTWQMGGRHSRDPQNDDAADIAAIRAAIEAGITHIDTAEIYASGYAERIVAQAIKGYDREKLLLVSKVSSAHLRYEDVIKSARASLERLGSKYLDLYLIHAPNPKIPIRETMRAMDTLIEEGLVRHIGVSNFTVERMEEAQSYTRHRIVANQLHYNLKFREPERKGLVKYCQEQDTLLVAWRPVEKGVLSARGIGIVDEMCRKYKKTPAQIAINWVVAQPNVVTLSKMRDVQHLQENLGALGWTLNQEDVERLRHEFPDQQAVSDIVPLI